VNIALAVSKQGSSTLAVKAAMQLAKQVANEAQAEATPGDVK
jgi:hypothetical protein